MIAPCSVPPAPPCSMAALRTSPRRRHRFSRWAAASALLLASGGCTSPWIAPSDQRPPSTVSGKDQGSSPITVDHDPALPDGSRAGSAAASFPIATSGVDDAALVGVMDKLQQVSELDPAATPRLLDELQQTSPKFWPAVAERFRSSLAYHQQLVARRERVPGEDDLERGTAEPLAAIPDPAAPSPDLPPPFAPADRTVAPVDFTTIDRMGDGRGTESGAEPPAPIYQPPPAIRRPPPAPSPPPANDWHELLEMAADDLNRRVVASPASTAEVHQHATLRMLRLLAGQTEQALEPIPRVSPTEQDYWSQQLFALATYLDHHSQPDDKRRAAATAMHLDEALAHLREVGSLSLRNLTFCRKVIGYGAYEPYAAASFSPGQQVTLYVEVENYRSRSTEQGFCTSLGSSYEVLDEAGQRVEGGEFPDVDDCCRSRRRDFHIQYTLTLPAKIGPGRYRLQLILRDRQSDKIGNAAAAFEVGQ